MAFLDNPIPAIFNSPDKGVQNEETDILNWGSGGGVDSDMQPACKAMDLCNLCIEYTVTSAFDSGLAGLVSALVGDGGDLLYQKYFMMLSVKVAKPRKHNNVYLLVCLLLHVHGQAHITPSS